MSEIKSKEKKFSITFDKEARKGVSNWIIIDQLNNQVDARVGRGRWYATRYFSSEGDDGSLTFFVEVEVIEGR